MRPISRRRLVAAAAAGLIVPPALRAQQPAKVWRIGFLSNGTVESGRSISAGCEKGLAEHGLVIGRNVTIEKRWAEGKLDRLPALTADLLASGVDIILAPSGIAAMAAKKSGTSLPIVFALAPDPVGQGFAQSLQRPGGNMTGMTSTHTELSAKRLQLIQESFPAARRIAVLYYRAGSAAGVEEQLAETERGAALLGMAVRAEEAPRAEDFDRAFAAMRQQKPDALVVIENPMFFANRARITERAATLRIPAVYNVAEYVHSGGLMSFGASYADLCRRAAGHVAKILRGANPGDLPIERPTKFELVVSLACARTMGLALPQSLLARADEVIG